MPHLSSEPVKDLSMEAKEILIAATKRREVFVLQGPQVGKWVASGPHHFIDLKNPGVKDAYFQAFLELCRSGFLIHKGGNQYGLTEGAIRLGRGLVH